MKTPRWDLVLIALLFFAACSQQQTPKPVLTSKPSTPIDPTTVASITGTITFTGPQPTPQKIDTSADPACGSQPMFDQSLAVTNGDLANVFVYVKDGLSNRSFAPPSAPVIIQQRGCRYQQHIAVALIGQTVEFENDDQTTHNIHMMPRQLKQWNESQMPSAAPIEKQFDQPEIMVPIKCNQHPWMHMYLSIVSNPFYAVTGKDGKFEIHGLPPGTYTIAAVQEKLGEQDIKVTVSAKQSKTVDFIYTAK